MAYGHQSKFAAEIGTRPGQSAYKRQLAYRHLGVNPIDVQTVPFFRSELRRIARCVNQGCGADSLAPPVRPLDFLQSSEDPNARRVSEVYLSVPESYRRLLPAEAYCQAAGVSPWRVLEAITVVAVRQGAQASAILASIMRPRVLNKTIERALQEDGTRERLMLHKALGSLHTAG